MIKMSDKEREGYDVLRAEMPDALAMEVVEYRRERKAKITARIAKALLREYKAFGDIEKAIEQQMVRNWIGFEAAWIKKPQGFTDQHHPTPRPTANYGAPKPANDEPAAAKIDPEKRAQLVDMARRAARGMRA
jgi:hypothetical protein